MYVYVWCVSGLWTDSCPIHPCFAFLTADYWQILVSGMDPISWGGNLEVRTLRAKASSLAQINPCIPEVCFFWRGFQSLLINSKPAVLPNSASVLLNPQCARESTGVFSKHRFSFCKSRVQPQVSMSNKLLLLLLLLNHRALWRTNHSVQHRDSSWRPKTHNHPTPPPPPELTRKKIKYWLTLHTWVILAPK